MASIPIEEYNFIKSADAVNLDLGPNYFTCADLHLGHKNLLTYEPARLSLGDTIEEADEAIIRKWNLVVKKEDVVLFLGDVSFASAEATREYMRRLNGVKMLVMGNHDRPRSVKFWKELFAAVFREPVVVGGSVYSHEPVSCDYLNAHGCSMNVHGHTHSKKLDSRRHLCVSVEQTGFFPVWAKDLSALMFYNSYLYDAHAPFTVESIQEACKKAMGEKV